MIIWSNSSIVPFLDTPSRLYIGLNIGVAGKLRVGSRQRKVEVKGYKSEEGMEVGQLEEERS